MSEGRVRAKVEGRAAILRRGAREAPSHAFASSPELAAGADRRIARVPHRSSPRSIGIFTSSCT